MGMVDDSVGARIQEMNRFRVIDKNAGEKIHNKMDKHNKERT